MLIKPDKTNHIVRQFEAYVNEVLGLSIHVKPWDGERRLPLYLRESYTFYKSKLIKTDAVLMLPKGGVDQTPANLAKHMMKVREKWDHDLIFVDEAVSSLKRKRMIGQKIPFVIPGNQLYLPMMGMDLREHFKKIHTDRDTFSPSTQVLVLDAIHQRKAGYYTPTESAARFGYSVMTMTRAFDELEQAGLGEHTVRGKERCLHFLDTGKDLWKVALPFLKSPVKKMLYISGPVEIKTAILAGLSAMTAYSNLSDPENPALAIDHGDSKKLLNDRRLKIVDQPEPGDTAVELWSYPPALFARKGITDRLSLFLSVEGVGDERIESAKEDLLKDMPW